MHDVKKVEANPDEFDRRLGLRGHGPAAGQLLSAWRSWKDSLLELEKLRAERNGRKAAVSDEVRREEARALNLRISELESIVRLAHEKYRELMFELPNLPVDVPFEEMLDPPTRSFDFVPRPHWELFGSMSDQEAATRMSGSRFSVLTGDLARLERAIGQFMIHFQTRNRGFTEASVPYLVHERALYGTGQLPKFAEDLYRTEDGLYLIPTGEVPLTNVVRETVLEEGDLPIRYAALTPCFRREAGSAGRDTRGILRQHQFNKVEMVSIVHPANSFEEFKRVVDSATAVLFWMRLPHRTRILTPDDVAFSSAFTVDVEAWMPGQGEFREVSSVSLCTDFQARRMGTAFLTEGGGSKEFPHTINGSGLAVGRVMAAVVENGQQEDGSIVLPDVLVPYIGTATIPPAG